MEDLLFILVVGKMALNLGWRTAVIRLGTAINATFISTSGSNTRLSFFSQQGKSVKEAPYHGISLVVAS